MEKNTNKKNDKGKERKRKRKETKAKRKKENKDKKRKNENQTKRKGKKWKGEIEDVMKALAMTEANFVDSSNLFSCPFWSLCVFFLLRCCLLVLLDSLARA